MDARLKLATDIIGDLLSAIEQTKRIIQRNQYAMDEFDFNLLNVSETYMRQARRKVQQMSDLQERYSDARKEVLES